MNFANLFKDIKGFLGELFENETWEQAAANDIALVSPAIQLVIAETVGEDDAAEVSQVTAEVEKDLNLVASIIAGTKSTIQSDQVAKIRAVLATVKANLSSLLSAGHIKNEKTLEKVTTIVNGVISEIDAVLSILPQYTN